jgi:uncharacterized protein (DUF302 family)
MSGLPISYPHPGVSTFPDREAETEFSSYVSIRLPLQFLLYEDERGRAVIAYDQPSSLLGQFRDEPVPEVARMLDRKRGEVAARAAE